MSDFFEIDFLNVESKKSGDAIPIHYRKDGITRIHVTDGGFQSTGDKLVSHINTYYDSPSKIDSIIVTHPDGDHAGGLRKLFEEFEIGELWMLRPWMYADELIDRFSRFKSVTNLKMRLKEIYPNLVALEELADENGVPIYEPFQGKRIGEFVVMAPKLESYLNYIVESDKTPEILSNDLNENFSETLSKILESAVNFVRSAWGEEIFSSDDTSPENNMSIVQYANLCNKRILLTGDAGRLALNETIKYAPSVGLNLPGIDRIQIPHHGSRHNVSSEILDELLGSKLDSKPEDGKGTFSAIVSASKDDESHPRKAVVRAFIHRGANVISNENSNIRTSHNAPDREGWSSVKPVIYPDNQEE